MGSTCSCSSKRQPSAVESKEEPGCVSLSDEGQRKLDRKDRPTHLTLEEKIVAQIKARAVGENVYLPPNICTDGVAKHTSKQGYLPFTIMENDLGEKYVGRICIYCIQKLQLIEGGEGIGSSANMEIGGTGTFVGFSAAGAVGAVGCF